MDIRRDSSGKRSIKRTSKTMVSKEHKRARVFLNSFVSSNVLVRKRTQYEIEFSLLLEYRPTLFARDHDLLRPDRRLRGFRFGGERGKIRVSANPVHSIVIVIVMILRVTLASSRRHCTKRLFAVAQPKIPSVI